MKNLKTDAVAALCFSLFLLEHPVGKCSSRMPFEEIANRMGRHCNSDARKLSLQSEMDGLELSLFMQKHQINDVSPRLKQLVDFINALTLQLLNGFGDGKHKNRYLRRAVMGFDWARNPLTQLTTSQYSFEQFIMALNESIQLLNELSRA